MKKPTSADPVSAIRSRIDANPARSAWLRGVRLYASELLDELDEAISCGYFDPDDLTNQKAIRGQLLNGAADWSQYSWGGSSLIYDSDIAERLCTPSELKRTRNGDRRPNSHEEWLDTQARALSQASRMILSAARDICS